MKLRFAALALAAPLALTAVAAAPAAVADTAETPELTVATFNASLNRFNEGELQADLADPQHEQAQNVAETIQRSGADIVLVNEFDYDAEGESVQLFHDNFLAVSQNGAPAAEYPYSWAGPVNTGVPSGLDLNNDGTVGGPDDAFGFGYYPGQYGFVVYSKYPIDAEQVRTFQNFKWQDMPDALLPENADGTPWFDDEELAAMPLSSKTHADVPVDVDGTTVHVLAAHPTPPSFDGEEKRNQKRNHDEIRLWADYVANDADYLYDDNGVTGGLETGANFVILGDYNADPVDGDSWDGAIQQFLDNELILDPMPTSEGAVEASALQGGANESHQADPALDTADFNDDPSPGNLRVDYVLPNAAANVSGTGVFWPTREDELVRLTGEYPFPTSDHRLVWVTLTFPATVEPAPTETDGAPIDTTTPTATAEAPEEPGLPTAEPTSEPTTPTSEPTTPASERDDEVAVDDAAPHTSLPATGVDRTSLFALIAGGAAIVAGAGALALRRRGTEH